MVKSVSELEIIEKTTTASFQKKWGSLFFVEYDGVQFILNTILFAYSEIETDLLSFFSKRKNPIVFLKPCGL